MATKKTVKAKRAKIFAPDFSGFLDEAPTSIISEIESKKNGFKKSEEPEESAPPVDVVPAE